MTGSDFSLAVSAACLSGTTEQALLRLIAFEGQFVERADRCVAPSRAGWFVLANSHNVSPQALLLSTAKFDLQRAA